MLAESRILIVDDNRDLLEDWAEILAGEGARVQTASSGVEGLHLSRDPFDVALVDVRLPDMTGTSMVPQLRRVSPDSEVLLITGHGTVENAIEAVRTDAYDYLLKPVAPVQLLSRVSRACEHVRAKRESGELRDELNRESLFNQNLIETAQAIILVLDVDGRIVKFNPYMEELCGYHFDEIRGQDWFETFLPVRERERVRAVFADAVAGKTVRGNVNPVVTKSGEERIIEWSARILADLDGSVGGVLSTGIDITERRRAEIELRHAQKMEAVGSLASGVAHDFNNLLMGILGCVDMALRETDAQGDARAYLKEVRVAASTGASIVKELLAFTRKEADETPTVVEPDRLLEDMRGLIQRLAGDDVELHLSSAAPGVAIQVGMGQLEQVLLNLVVNARQAMPEGGQLSIGTEQILVDETVSTINARLSPGPHVVITVQDTGCGIPEDIHDRVFEPFFTTKSPGEGTGLGLSTVFGIVQRAGGAIELQSELGSGTTFRVHLPTMTTATRARSTGEPAPDRGSTEPLPMRAESASLLIVEDQNAARLAMKDGLEEQGHSVLDAKTAAEALELFAAHASELRIILTDVGLPDMAGTELVRRIRERAPSVGVIYLTGRPADDPLLEGLVDGHTVLLSKPLGLDRIEAAVARMVACQDTSPARG